MKKIMNIVAVLTAAFLLSGYLATDNFNVVARIFGREIFISDLDPSADELRMIKRSRDLAHSQGYGSQVSDDQIVSEVRSEKLASLIWDPIMDEFARTHNVEPTDQEIDDFARAMEAFTAMLPDRQLADDSRISPKMKKEVEREMGQHFVKTWKISKALYEEYGGIVIFQQANPMEPVGAMRKLLEIHEAKGDFIIYDETLKQRFWKYYLEPLRWKITPPDKIDYSEPWWLKKPIQGPGSREKQQ